MMARFGASCTFARPSQPDESDALSPGVSVVIPAYESAGRLDQLMVRLNPVLQRLDCAFEIIFVDDGSGDDTWGSIRSLAVRWTHVRGIRHQRNYGQHNALLCGIRCARYSVIVTMDDDLQHPPEAIPELLDALTRDIDVVYASPAAKHHAVWRIGFSHAMRVFLSWLTGVAALRHASAFRAFRTQLRGAFDGFRSPCTSIDALLTWGTTRHSVVAIDFESSNRGFSNYSISRLIRHAGQTIVAFSTRPLQMATVMGAAVVMFGLLTMVLFAIDPALGGWSEYTWPIFAGIGLVASGAILMSIGLLGVYLACLHLQSIGTPCYVICDEVSGNLKTAGKSMVSESAA